MAAICAQSSAASAQSAGGKSFFDGFAALDRTRWSVSNDWANGDHQNCMWSASNVKPVGKAMTLVLNNRRSGSRNFSCAELQTRAVYGHGTYEARMRPAAGAGIVSAFFSYAGPAHGGNKAQERWFSFEFVGKEQSSVQLNFFAAGTNIHRQKVELGFDPSAAMNDYAIQWSPKVVRWFVNGKLVHAAEITAAARAVSSPAKIFVSLRNGVGADQEAWLGQFAYAGAPFLTTYEYVAFTELGGQCQFPTSVVCRHGLQ